MKEIIESFAQALLGRPDAVSVVRISGKDASVFALRAAREDIPKIVGENGRTENALHKIVHTVSSKTNTRWRLEIIA